MEEAGCAAGFSRPDILWADTIFSIIFSVSTTPASGNMTTGRLIPVPMGTMMVKDNASAQEDAADDDGKVQKTERQDSDGRKKEQKGGRANNIDGMEGDEVYTNIEAAVFPVGEVDDSINDKDFRIMDWKQDL